MLCLIIKNKMYTMKYYRVIKTGRAVTKVVKSVMIRKRFVVRSVSVERSMNITSGPQSRPIFCMAQCEQAQCTVKDLMVKDKGLRDELFGTVHVC